MKGLSIMAVLKDMIKKTFRVDDGKVETSLIEEFMYPKYGPGQLWEKVAKEFKKLGGKIEMRTKVVGVKQEKGKIVAVEFETEETSRSKGVKSEDGRAKTGRKVKTKEIKGDIFISSMPLKDLVLAMDGATKRQSVKNRGAKNQVPKKIKKIAAGLPYRDFVTVGLLVKKLNLKNETDIKTLGNIVPDCWIYVQEPEVKLGRIQIFNNWSPYMVKEPKKTVWIGLEYFCSEGDEFWRMSKRKLIKFATDELVKMGVIGEGEVLDAHCEKVKKAYPAYFDTYEQIDELVEYLNKFENLYCVGRNGQHRYNNMDHSMVTSFEAVRNILSGEKDKTNIWNVNTEKEYHEMKEG